VAQRAANASTGATMKHKLGPVNALYPSLTVLVGALVEGKPNFCPVAHVGVATPGSISLGMGKRHHTNAGILANRVFSVNIPSQELVAETDWCGMQSGREVDKSRLFELFYGELPAAPMIASCPVTMECRLIEHVAFATHDLFIGEVVQTYAEAAVLSAGHVDVQAVRPLLFDMASKEYWSLGPRVARCWNVGSTLTQTNDGK
jgi:flavin reductase (DIM6/NTAB) family NADH-FMN oxidoreductase RutF